MPDTHAAPTYATSNREESRFRKSQVVATLATLGLLLTLLGPVSLSQAATIPANDTDAELLDSPDSGGYIVQVKDGTEVEDVVEDTLPTDEVQDLSGEAFEGGVVDITESEAKLLTKDPRVVSVEPDAVISASDRSEGQRAEPLGDVAAQSVSSAGATATWGLDRSDDRQLPTNGKYNPRSTGSGSHIFIVDGGIDRHHPDFGGRVGFSAHTSSAGSSPDDCDGHGTHVAGIAASNRYGIAKGATLHSVRVLNCSGSGSISSVLSGLNWVAENAPRHSVANLSLGGSNSYSVNAAVQNLRDNGVAVVVAAGNEGSPACASSPANSSAAITVGAVDSRDREASWSNYGSCVDLFAPGVKIVSTRLGSSTPQSESGTSMAAPHVAGALAALWSRYPNLSPRQVQAELLRRATSGVVRFPLGQSGSPNKLLYVDRKLPKKASVLAKSVSSRSKLKVDVNPNRRAWNYRISIQKKIRGKWRTVRNTKTRGRADTRTLNLPKGRYRVKVLKQRGFKVSYSKAVRLRR